MAEHTISHAHAAQVLSRLINDPASVDALAGTGTHDKLIAEVAELAARFSGSIVTPLDNGTLIVDAPATPVSLDVWGLLPSETLDALGNEYQAWCALHGYAPMSADELLADLLEQDGIDPNHLDYLARFVDRWDRAPR